MKGSIVLCCLSAMACGKITSTTPTGPSGAPEGIGSSEQDLSMHTAYRVLDGELGDYHSTMTTFNVDPGAPLDECARFMPPNNGHHYECSQGAIPPPPGNQLQATFNAEFVLNPGQTGQEFMAATPMSAPPNITSVVNVSLVATLWVTGTQAEQIKFCIWDVANRVIANCTYHSLPVGGPYYVNHAWVKDPTTFSAWSPYGAFDRQWGVGLQHDFVAVSNIYVGDMWYAIGYKTNP